MQLFYSSAIQSTAQSGYIGGQNGGAMCVVPAKDRGANMEHEPLAFECWFCAVLRYQRANSRGDCFIACFIGCFNVCFFAWAVADCALHRLASQSGAFIHCLCTTAAAALLFASFIMLYLVLRSYQFWRAMQLTQPIIINGSII
jgi:hypothetical protein